MSLTIAIPTYNRYHKVKRLLTCLSNQTYKDFSVVIIDASEEKENLSIQNYGISIKQIAAIKPNLPMQRRQAVEICTTKYIGFLDDDTTVDKHFIEKMFEILPSTSENCAGVTAWVQNLPSRSVKLTKSFRRFLAGVNPSNAGRLNTGGIANPFSSKPEKEVHLDHLQGPCMFYKTKLVKDLGKLPWLYELYSSGIGRSEDIALSTAISKHGYKYILNPKITCFHHTEGGGSPFARSGLNKGMADSLGRFKVAINSKSVWGIMNTLIFFRFSFITFVLLNPMVFRDKQYRKGYFKGVWTIITKYNSLKTH